LKTAFGLFSAQRHAACAAASMRAAMPGHFASYGASTRLAVAMVAAKSSVAAALLATI